MAITPQPMWEAFRRLVDAINLTAYGSTGQRVLQRRIDRMKQELEKATQQMTKLRANWFQKIMDTIHENEV